MLRVPSNRRLTCSWNLQHQLYLAMYYDSVLKRRSNRIGGYQPFEGEIATSIHIKHRNIIIPKYI